jgi:predicted TPR repeat methyltransferase
VSERYDQAYFDRWYRDPDERIRGRGELQRKAAMVVGIAEHLLGRRIRNVLDVGCGEAEWLAPLKGMRPSLDYLGIDPSEYAVERFGRTRRIRRGSLQDVGSIAGDRRWDLVVCSDVLHYIGEEDLIRSLPPLACMTGGVAYLDVTTVEDDPIGDMEGFHHRDTRWYRSLFADAGFSPCGMQCYVGPELSEAVASLEHLE